MLLYAWTCIFKNVKELMNIYSLFFFVYIFFKLFLNYYYSDFINLTDRALLSFYFFYLLILFNCFFTTLSLISAIQSRTYEWLRIDAHEDCKVLRQVFFSLITLSCLAFFGKARAWDLYGLIPHLDWGAQSELDSL